MAGVTNTSPLMAKFGKRLVAAAEAGKDLPHESAEMGLPAGIEGGIAELRNMRIQEIKPGKANAGQLIFYADAVVLSPEMHNGQKVAGSRTSITENIFDTPNASRKTFEEHIAWIQNLLKGFGIPEGSPDLEGPRLEATMKALAEPSDPTQRVRFRFRTWKGADQKSENRNGKWFVVADGKVQKGPYATLEALKAANKFVDTPSRTNSTWGDACEWNGAADVPYTDNTGGSAAGSPGPAPAPGSDAAAEQFDEFAQPTDGDGGEPQNEQPGEDLDALTDAANNQDQKAQQRLIDLAIAAGHSKADVEDESKTWDDLKEMVQNPIAPEEPTAPAEPEKPAEPSVGDAAAYLPKDPKTGKPTARKPFDCEVIAVNRRSKTVDLKNTANARQQWKGVKWDAIN